MGAPIEVISGDHQNKPDVGAGIARQWIDADHVDAIVDVPTLSVALAVQDVTREKKRIFLMSGPASSDLTGKACGVPMVTITTIFHHATPSEVKVVSYQCQKCGTTLGEARQRGSRKHVVLQFSDFKDPA